MRIIGGMAIPITLLYDDNGYQEESDAHYHDTPPATAKIDDYTEDNDDIEPLDYSFGYDPG